jgi:hypothetical protein
MVSDCLNGFRLPQWFLIAPMVYWGNQKPLRQSETIEAIKNHWGNQKPLRQSESIGAIRNHWGNQKPLGQSETIGEIRNH